MRIAVLAPISWRTPPRHYGPWELCASLLTEGLVVLGHDVTLFATGDSATSARLRSVTPRGWSEDAGIDPKVAECLHISEVFDRATEFDVIHNHFDFLPLTYAGLTSTPMVTTIHGFSSPQIVPVYAKYNGRAHYVAISEADRHPALDYVATIHHGINMEDFLFHPEPGNYLAYFGRIHPDKGLVEAIATARWCGIPIRIAGIVQDEAYFADHVKPLLDGENVRYVGPVGGAERSAFLGGAMALLHLISFDEPFGLSVVEAMACGTPVIAFDRGSMRELIDEGVTGAIVPDVQSAAEAVQRVAGYDRGTVHDRAVQRFDSKRMVGEYVSVYEEVVESGAGSAL
jgi:glycosyltransferase involved in cell wall biosynthesis